MYAVTTSARRDMRVNERLEHYKILSIYFLKNNLRRIKKKRRKGTTHEFIKINHTKCSYNILKLLC